MSNLVSGLPKIAQSRRKLTLSRLYLDSSLLNDSITDPWGKAIIRSPRGEIWLRALIDRGCKLNEQ